MPTLSMEEVANRAEEILQRLAAEFPGDDAFPVELPPDNGLRTLLEEVFWASIARDENRPCRFTVSYLWRQDDTTSPDIIVLKRKPFGRQVLRRLAAVAFAANAEIAVAHVDGGLSIIGLCKRLGPLEGSGRSPLPIEIETSAPGHIAVRYGVHRILTYMAGVIMAPRPNILLMPGPFRAALDDLEKAAGMTAKSLRSDLRQLLGQVERNGHGGLLILSTGEPKGVEPVAWSITSKVYDMAEAHRLWSESNSKLDLPADDPDRLSFYQLIERQRRVRMFEGEIMQLLASLALTDGAVWLDGGLCPRAFGVFVRFAPDLKIWRVDDVAGAQRAEMRFETLGARHRAMVSLAGQNPGCPAIGLSVDGGISAALRPKDVEDVLVWQNLQSWDFDVEDRFDPQYQTIMFEAVADLLGGRRLGPSGSLSNSSTTGQP